MLTPSLEIKMRKFVSVTQGTTVHLSSEIEGIPFLRFDILEVKPSSPFKSVCMINTDVEIDFAPPLDYVEPAPPSPKRNKKMEAEE